MMVNGAILVEEIKLLKKYLDTRDLPSPEIKILLRETLHTYQFVDDFKLIKELINEKDKDLAKEIINRNPFPAC